MMKNVFSLFWFALALFVANPVAAQIPSDGLVGYWPFTGNANDASGNGNHGIIYANLTNDRFGSPNSAYNFSQGSKIEVPMTQQLFEIPVRSFSFWFRLSANQTGGRIYETTFQNGGIGFYAGSMFDTWYGYSQHCCNIVGLSGGPIGVWHHIVVNSNDYTGFTQVYLDGVQISTSNGYPAGNGCFSNTAWQWQGEFMRFGQGANGEAYFGDIDDISIYNRALTPEEITQLYTDQTSVVEVPCTPFLGEDQTVCAGTSVTLSASGSSLACPTLPGNLQNGLVGYWPFCGNANDASGNGNNGTVNGATLTTDRFGNANSAYSFDGYQSQYISGVIGSSFNQSFTVNAWATKSLINTSNYPFNLNQWIFSFGLPETNSGFHLGLYGNSSIITYGTWGYAISGGAQYSSNWEMATVTYLNGTYSLYKNGSLIEQVGSSISIASNLFKIGNQIGSYAEFWNGNIDDITLHNRALTATEIQQLYTLGQTTYLWSSGATTPTIDVSPIETTTYWCTVTTNGVSCTDSVTVTVQQPDLYYADQDNDGFGAGAATNSCVDLGAGYVTNNTDCNDNNANQNAAFAEICNGEDDDCDGAIDNGLVFLDYYTDLDSDGFGAGAATNSCVDLGAGYVTNNGDCNNANALINPNATEICNSIDDNCDGQIDEGITFTTYYQDFDNDGFGTGDAVTSCTNPGAGWVTNNTDCDDTNANINTAANEICNDIDDNCNNAIDDGLTFTDYYADQDNDGFGAGAATSSCVDLGIGYVLDNTDCNDTDANINPGAEDLAGNGIDENCDGQIDNSIAELSNAFILYPNPASTNITLQVNSNLVGKEMMIYDATGKLIHQQKILSTQTQISLSQMATGHYMIRIDEEIKQFEIIK